MTRENILELQKAHIENYNQNIKPLIDKAEHQKKVLADKFNIALEAHYDTVLIDTFHKPIKVGNVIEVIEHNIIGIVDGIVFDTWRTESHLLAYSAEKWDFKRTGKTRKKRYICTDRKVQFVFGEMCDNYRIITNELKNGKQLKSERTFNPKECKEFSVIQ